MLGSSERPDANRRSNRIIFGPYWRPSTATKLKLQVFCRLIPRRPIASWGNPNGGYLRTEITINVNGPVGWALADSFGSLPAWMNRRYFNSRNSQPTWALAPGSSVSLVSL